MGLGEKANRRNDGSRQIDSKASPPNSPALRRSKLFRIILSFFLLIGMLPIGQASAHEPVIYGPDGKPLVTGSQTQAANPMGTEIPTIVGEVISADRAGRAADDDDPCFDVSGVIGRVERTPTSAGTYLADTLVPVRFALLELREEDPISDDSYGEVYTGADGRYSFHFCDDDGIGGGALELYLRLYARVFDPATDHEVAYVTDISYVDDIYEFNSSIFGNEDGGTFPIDMVLGVDQSGVFNITDAIYDAWTFFQQSGGIAGDGKYLDETAKFMWELGYDEGKGSYHMDYGAFAEIVVGAAPDPDIWDESPIIHEYGHFIEDRYSCDESGGGEHNFTDILGDPEFAWSEGYANYFQGAVRSGRGYPEANFYLDINTNPPKPGFTNDIAIDVETWHTQTFTTTSLVTPNNELSVAALFWDLLDGNNDDQDRVSHGHPTIQDVYTDEFNDQWGDEECTVPAYFEAWQAMKYPADTDTAAVIVQNTGVLSPFTLAAASADEEPSTFSPTSLAANTASSAHQWWKHLVLISDVSKSMTGTKLNAVKTVLTEQVSDIAQNSTKGTEFSLYSFDNTKTSNKTLLAGKFYPELVTPAINSLTANSANDPNCPVESLRAMSQAIGPKQKGDAWLFTDGDALQSISVETLVKALNSRQMRGSFALLGDCNSATPDPQDVSGAAQNYLGLGANATQPGGIVPYLLTALGSGGQFLFVDPGQMEAAADILRAQLSHSAGAGRWSDYVSTNQSYLYDKLTPSEFKWIDTTPAAGGTNRGTPNPSVSVPLPSPFTYFNSSQSTAQVYRYGYLTFGASPQTVQLNNTTIPNPLLPNTALYPLWDDLYWNNPPAVAAAGSAPADADALQVDVTTKSVGDWFAISTIGTSSTEGAQRAYQVLLNSQTGEIRFQYKSDINSSTATIGIENPTGTIATQVSFNDLNGAKNNMGYKFTPALSQPSRTYTVSVDGLTSSVGFLLTGYSGNFASLAVRTPNNTLISCADSANVLCITSGLVQYVQVKVNGRKGNWTATVAPGNKGVGTFTFSAIGASTVTPASSNDRTLSVGPQFINLNLENDGQPLTRSLAAGQLTGRFTTPDGKPFGSTFTFYDDGAHNDGAPDDGRFGSDAFTPPGAGVGYLWVEGTLNGEPFSRSDSTPFNFQPLEVTSLGDGANYGDITPLSFSIKNSDTVTRCYDRATEVPSGWAAEWNMTLGEKLFGLCLSAGETVSRTVDIKMAATSPNTLPSGAVGDIIVTFIEREAGTSSDSATASVTRHRLPAYITIDNRNPSGGLRPNGIDSAALKITALDDQMVSVAEGTSVRLDRTMGVISPTQGTIQQGKLDVVFTTPLVAGTAVISVAVGSLVATTTLTIAAPLAEKLVLTATTTTLPAIENSAGLTVTVTDRWDQPVANQMVRIGVSGDGEAGTVGGSEVITGTTSASGQIVATFARGSQSGSALVTATLLVDENGVMQQSLTDSVAILVLAESRHLFLPQINK